LVKGSIKAFFMYTVYVLYSIRFDKIYIGYTTDLEDRFKSHNELATKGWTIRFRPWSILHTENFDSKSDAMKRELQLKSAAGRAYIRGLIPSKK
jgi:putative endonuclease